MSEPLRPHVVQLDAPISVVRAWPLGGYVVATRKSVRLVDDNLVAGEPIVTHDATLDVLPDGRLIIGDTKACQLWKPGATLEKLDVGEYVRELFPTEDGFIAVGRDRIVYEKAGTRTTQKLGKDRYVHPARWRDGLALADTTGLQFVDGAGVETAKSPALYLTGAPVVIGERLVVRGLHDQLHVLDANAQPVAEYPAECEKICAFAGGVLLVPKHSVTMFYELIGLGETDVVVPRWRLETPNASPRIVGEYLVLQVENGVWIVDGNGEVVERITDLPHATEVAAFEDGISLFGTRSVWWRPGHGITELDYAGAPRFARTAPSGVVAAEEEVLLVWRAGAQGPTPTPLVTDLPLGRTIIVDGQALIVDGTNRFTLNTRYPGNSHTYRRSPAYRGWRELTSRDDAAAIVEQLTARSFEGELPALPAGTLPEQTAALATLPLAQTASLVGRGLFATASLDEAQLRLARAIRPAFIGELALVLDRRMRLLLAAIRARRARLEPPQPVAGYDYLGTFTTSGALVVADPAYIDKRASAGISLALKVAAHEGIWHAFVRDAKRDVTRTAELAVVHDLGFSVGASDAIGTIGVDSGLAGVYDKACAKPNLDAEPVIEGTLSGLGAIAHTGFGDGGYPVFVGRTQGKVSKIRISFIDDTPEVDRLVAIAADAQVRPYSATTKYALNDVLEHVKFGVGTVIRVGADGKMDVRFADATRTLVHSKK